MILLYIIILYSIFLLLTKENFVYIKKIIKNIYIIKCENDIAYGYNVNKDKIVSYDYNKNKIFFYNKIYYVNILTYWYILKTKKYFKKNEAIFKKSF